MQIMPSSFHKCPDLASEGTIPDFNSDFKNHTQTTHIQYLAHKLASNTMLHAK